MKVMSVVGSRPNIIKLAPMCSALKKHKHCIVDTGQHYDYLMDRLFFDSLGIQEPDFNLNVGSASHAVQTAHMMERIEPVVDMIDPDVVLVYGDTNSTLAGALTAKKMGYPIGHIEAGCRTHEPFFIEEINRTLVDRISDLLFCPTHRCLYNLWSEGHNFGLHYTGDVMADLIYKMLPNIPRIRDSVKPFILITIHRAENTDNKERLAQIIDGIGKYDTGIILPVHPRTRKAIDTFDIQIPENVRVTVPTDYETMLCLIKNATGVITDSGGIQKEAFIIGTPCITVRPKTEWPETLELGWNVLVEPKDLPFEIKHPGTRIANTFGNGNAAEEIVTILETKYGT